MKIKTIEFRNFASYGNKLQKIEFEDKMMNYYPGMTYDDEIYIHFFAYVGDWCPQFGVVGAACSNPEEFCELYSDCLKERKL